MLFIVATPIGNIEDITFRAIRTLKESDLILVEDTRRAGKLLKKYEIKTKMTSYHEYTTEKKEDVIIKMLEEGKNISLISDSGTPLISDPGFKLVRKAVEKKIKVSPIPGANAAISALCASACTTDKFFFLGFFPKKKNEQKKVIEKIKNIESSFILYESPYRIKKTLETVKEELPERKLCLAREISKKFEEFLYGNANEILEKIDAKNIKGEIVLIVDKK